MKAQIVIEPGYRRLRVGNRIHKGDLVLYCWVTETNFEWVDVTEDGGIVLKGQIVIRKQAKP